MLASIHPLGERARHNRFWITATAYIAGSVAGGASLVGSPAPSGRRFGQSAAPSLRWWVGWRYSSASPRRCSTLPADAFPG